MSKQDCTSESNITALNMDDEFQNIENTILTIFKILNEYDNLIKVVENECEKFGGEKLD